MTRANNPTDKRAIEHLLVTLFSRKMDDKFIAPVAAELGWDMNDVSTFNIATFIDLVHDIESVKQDDGTPFKQVFCSHIKGAAS